MDVFAVRTYFNAHVLSFFETVLHLDPRQMMTGRHHAHDNEQQHQQDLQKRQRLKLEKKKRRQRQQQQHQELQQQQQWKHEQQRKRSLLAASGGQTSLQVGSDGSNVAFSRPISVSRGGDTKEDTEVLGGGGGVRNSSGINGGGGDRAGFDGSGSSHCRGDDGDDDEDGDGGAGGSGGMGTYSNTEGGRKGGGGDDDSKKKAPTLSEHDFGDSASNPGRCQFAQLRVTASFAGKTYGDLVRHLISHGAIPLGLYRPPGTKGSTLSYTHINPDPDEPLRAWPKASEADEGSWGFQTGRRGASSAWEEGARGLADSTAEEEEIDSMFQRHVSNGGSGCGNGGGGSVVWTKVAAQTFPARGGGGGDEVFVVRSRTCALSKEVALDP